MTFVKDKSSGAVLNTSDDYEQYRRDKALIKKVKSQKTDIEQIKDKLNNIERMLKELLER